ncbi:MAG: hypothetical protein IJW36_03650, partial [Clostridia bacterium]|nr:hypothetical protein [Clostridia bacterium]
MSTKNKKIKTYDLETVFSEYMAYLSQANTERSSALSADVETLIEQLEADKLALQHIQENLTKATQLEKEIKKIKVLTIDEAVNLGASIAKTEETYEKRTSAYEKLLNTDTSLFTEEQMQKWNANIAKAEEAMHKASERLEKLRKKHETNVANEELLATKTQELDALIFVEGDETAEVPEDGTVKDYLTGLVAEATAIVKEKEQELKQMQAELKVVSSEPVATLESFKAFLEENGLSTIHAEELFRYRHNPEKFEHLAIEDFAMRKMHPTRDAIIKKVVVPTAITSVAVGATIGAIAGSGLVGGSEVLGFIPVSGTPGLTATATTLTGAFAGLVSTPIIIKGKNLTTRTYYKLKSQSAAKNVEDYNDGTDLANIRASKLIAKIQHTQHSILSSRGPKSLLLKVINRNRIHQIVDYTIDLYKIYHEIESDETIDIKLKAETLKPIYDMLVNVEEFITNDIAEEITHSMLTCTTKKEHTTHMIENVDIYARLKITLDRLARANATEHEIAQQMKSAKKATRNITQKKQEAYKLVTGVKPITGVLNFERKYGEYIQVEQAEEPLAV